MDYRVRSPFLAGFFSFLMPGLGHIYSGAAKRGLIIFILSIIASSFAPILGLLDFRPFNVVSIVLVFLFIYLFAIIDSVKITRPLKYAYLLKKYNKWYLYIIALLLYGIIVQPCIGGVIKHFFVQPYRMPSGSMEPALLAGDYIFVNKFIYWNSGPKRGDIIVFKYPPDPSKDFVKRVAGIAGDILEIRNNRVIVNGIEEVAEYIKSDPNSKIGERFFGPIKIPEKSLFVLGDNIDHSYDSRYWGCLRTDKVKGRVASVYWSWDSQQSSVRWERIGMQIE